MTTKKGKQQSSWADKCAPSTAYLKQYPSETSVYNRFKTEDIDPNFHDNYIKNVLNWEPKR